MNDKQKKLAIAVTNILRGDEEFARRVYFDDMYHEMPKDPSLKIQVFTGEMAPGGKTPWHVHNGAALFLVTNGACKVEKRDTGEVQYHEAGEVFFEPVGYIHQATNVSDTEVYSCFGLKFTPPGREHDLYTEQLLAPPNRMFDPSVDN